MEPSVRKGDWVDARGFAGEVMRRRVAAVEAGRIYICRDEEYERAKSEGREPLCVGFRPEAISRVGE